MVYRNLEIQTVCQRIKGANATVVGTQVSPGKKRYITFLMCDDATFEAASMVTLGLYLASTTTKTSRASIVHATARKFRIDMQGTRSTRSSKKRPYMFPLGGPDPELPIMTIAGGKWLSAYASVNSVQLFMQFYDE